MSEIAPPENVDDPQRMTSNGADHPERECSDFPNKGLGSVCLVSQPAPVSTASFVVYIDESGDEGFKFPGSSEWFVVSAVVTRKSGDLEAVKLVDRVREKIGKPKGYELHYRKLEHEPRVIIANEIGEAKDLIWSAVAIHKPTLTKLGKERLYFYACRLLLERVCALCIEYRKAGEGDGSAEIIFSNRTAMSYADFREYLRLLGEMRDTNIVPRILPPNQVTASIPRDRRGLQIADAVASAVYFALTPGAKYGIAECRYVRAMRPRCFVMKGTPAGWGLKVFPKVAKIPEERHAFLKWAFEAYDLRK